MPYFPATIMPKRLKRETVREVDHNHSILNARDWNTQHREIIAIEKYLVGNGTESGAAGILLALLQAMQKLEDCANVVINHFSGVMASGDSILLPTTLISSTTTAPVLSIDNSIQVTSVTGFPASGHLTKFNNVENIINGSMISYGFGRMMTNQEIVSYDGLDTTSNKFLNCIRGIDGTTVQDLDGSVPAVILSGKASVLFGIRSFKTAMETVPNQIVVNQKADLSAHADIYDSNGIKIDTLVEMFYALSVTGLFEDVQIAEAES